jgi:hypothetical protein
MSIRGKVIDTLFVTVLFTAALCLQALPITSAYQYPETLPMDAPKRPHSLANYAFFLLSILLAVVLPLTIWDFSLLPLQTLFRLLLVVIGTVSGASLICSGIHCVVGVPRPDSIAQCGTVNVSVAHCMQVLSKAQTTDQFRSFPAIEPAVLVSAAVTFSLLAGQLAPESTLAVLLLKGLPFGVATIASAYFVAIGAYRVVDVIAGAGIGALLALLVGVSVQAERRPPRAGYDGPSDMSIRPATFTD